jgi:hypothetical protein
MCFNSAVVTRRETQHKLDKNQVLLLIQTFIKDTRGCISALQDKAQLHVVRQVVSYSN